MSGRGVDIVLVRSQLRRAARPVPAKLQAVTGLAGTSLMLLDFGRVRAAGWDFLFSLIWFEGK